MVRTNAPSKWQTGETLNQLRSLSIDNLDDRLDWLYKVWPRLAVRVVEDSRRLPPLHREAVRRWGESNLWPGHDGTWWGGGAAMAAPPQQPSASPAQPPSAVPGAYTRGGGEGAAMVVPPPRSRPVL